MREKDFPLLPLLSQVTSGFNPTTLSSHSQDGPHNGTDFGAQPEHLSELLLQEQLRKRLGTEVTVSLSKSITKTLMKHHIPIFQRSRSKAVNM